MGDGGDIDRAGLKLLPPVVGFAQQREEAGIGLAL